MRSAVLEWRLIIAFVQDEKTIQGSLRLVVATHPMADNPEDDAVLPIANETLEIRTLILDIGNRSFPQEIEEDEASLLPIIEICRPRLFTSIYVAAHCRDYRLAGWYMPCGR